MLICHSYQVRDGPAIALSLPVGVLREKGGWHELGLSAIATRDERIAIGENRFYQRREGHALHPARVPLAALDEQRRAMGSYNFAAQYQQEPVPAHGNMIRTEWLKTYDPATLDLSTGTLVQSWDCASKEGIHNDFSVGLTALVKGKHVHILDVVRERMEFYKLRERVITLARQYDPEVLLIEDAASGMQLIQTLRADSPLGVPEPLARRPENDKQARVASAASMIATGQLHLPRDASWLADFQAEVTGFPNARFDDQVDALSQLFIWLRDRYKFDDCEMLCGPKWGAQLQG